MKIAIIGTGNVGGALGRGWAPKGHAITFGARDLANPKIKPLLEAMGGRAKVASVRDAVAGAEAVVLAMPWEAAKDAISAAGDLSGKIVVDCINPVTADLKGLAIGQTTSAAEEIGRWAKGARVVKAFNMTGAANYLNPLFGGQAASMFICGDDAAAKGTVTTLAADLGFEVIDAGPLSSGRLLEPLALLWIRLAYIDGLGPDIAFKLLRR